MDKFVDALKAGVRAMREDLGPKEYSAVGRQIVCGHCGHTFFTARELLLDTRIATFVDLEWLNRGAVALVCAQCTSIQWFGGRPQEL